jgi:hypothetical protein
MTKLFLFMGGIIGGIGGLVGTHHWQGGLAGIALGMFVGITIRKWIAKTFWA